MTEEVYGLRLDEESGDLAFDEGFFTANMMNKVHINSLTLMVESDCLANLFYIMIGSRKVKQETVYDVVSSRYEKTTFSEEKVKALLDMGIVSGDAKAVNGEIVVASLTKEKAE